ncbi:MAG TPA: type II toxin-antitoxin system CcdA family antitoxin [Albitalea sp.]|nr:type II toxin-antitoxin system CcdA family antitoxin [Albitalea sp.]
MRATRPVRAERILDPSPGGPYIIDIQLRQPTLRTEKFPSSEPHQHPDWKRWNEENKAAITAYNARIAREGLPLARYRTFMMTTSKPSTPSSEPID